MTSKASRVTERLQHIRGAIENAKNDLGALTKEQFLADGKTQRAVIESFIGESVRCLEHDQERPSEAASPARWNR
jgi:uncharacterized protein with HEPN domain